MTPDRPTGPATYTAEEAVKYAYAQGRDDERARILAALPVAQLMVDEEEILRIGNGGEPTQTTEEYDAALAAAIEKVLGET